MENQPPKFVRWAVLIGIVVLINVFSFISVSYVLPAPEYSDFCEQRNVGVIETEEQCVTNDGKWNAYQGVPKADDAPSGYCDLNYECSMAYDDARVNNSQTAFLSLLVAGAVAIILGMFLKGSSIVAAGLSYGGVVLLIASGTRYLGDLDQLVQILAVGAALILVLAIAYRKFKD
ncbi:MAG: hypothetical protein ACJKSS_02650 [Patescibacteria group bacterium UBA2103]